MRKVIIPTIGVVFFIVSLIALSLNLGNIGKSLIISEVYKMTGLIVEIEDFDLSLKDQSVKITNLVLNNPEGFVEPHMLEIPELSIDLKLTELLNQKLHIEQMSLELKSLSVIKNEAGLMNIDALKALNQQEDKPSKPQTNSQGADSNVSNTQFFIEKLSLKLGAAKYIDYSQKPTKNQDFPINLSEEYSNIDNPKELIRKIISRAILNTSLKKITNLSLFTDGLSEVNRGLQKFSNQLKGLSGLLQ